MKKLVYLTKAIQAVFLIVLLVHVGLFYSIGERELITEIGKNYESYVLDYQDNKFEKVAVCSTIDLTENELRAFFDEFDKYPLTIYKSTDKLPDLEDEDYLYWFDFKIINPFGVTLVSEAEKAKEFGAGWESEYIWVIYKWILIEKVNTGVS